MTVSSGSSPSSAPSGSSQQMDQDSARASKAGIAGWVLFDWAAQPFYTLILTFIFAPYFVNVFIGDAVRGQAYWGYGAAVAGVLVAILSPIFGAVADATGRRKPWVFVFSLFLIAAMCGLWLAKPGAEVSVFLVLGCFILAAACAEFATVFTNAMMPNLVPASEWGRLSGLGWSAGYVGGLASLVILAGLLVPSPDTGKTLLGFAPLLSLDWASHEGDRLAGPFSALWYLVFVLPFFLFTPDSASRKKLSVAAIGEGLGALKQTFASLGSYGNIVLFLIARMIYSDGLAAIFAFGGIYAASIFGWGAFELGLFGILLTISGAIGAFFGGRIDDAIGSKPVILIALVGLMISTIGILSVDKNHIFFVTEVAEKTAGSGPFSSLGEQVCVLFALCVGLVAGPVQASSRTMLARLAPKDKMTEFFGLYAFSGKITSFLAPLLVGAMTLWFSSQRIGISIIVLFLIIGFALISFVRVRDQV